MAEVSQWNRPNKDKGAAAKGSSYSNRKGRPLARGLLAALVVVVGGVLAFYFICGQSESVAPGASHPVEKKRGKIAETTPAKPTAKPKAEKPKPKAAAPVEKPHPKIPTYRDERGILRYEGGARAPDPTRKVNPPLNIHAHERKIFKHNAEEHIAIVLGMKIGEPVIGDFTYDDRFVKSFKESLDEPIEILDTDSEQDREMKEAVIETKKELKERMDAGEDVAQIMNDTMDEFRRLGRYRHELQVQLAEIRNDTEKYSDQDVADFTAAANQMLEKEGIPPIKMPRLVMRGLKR